MAERAQRPPAEFEQALRELGLAGDETLLGEPLTGGVSSDIWRIDTAQGPVCAKRALSRLRVAAEWTAPIERNLYEARWMQVAETARPGSTPQLLGQHPGLGVLVMRYLPAAEYPLWKQQLRDGLADPATARAVGQTLVAIHAHSAALPELAPQFDSQGIFFDIRLDPYLLATADKHPDCAEALRALVTQTQAYRLALVHGDVSPKNILVGTQGPVLLDAECACWGDPAFDLAFCLNHLLLKALWNPAARAGYRQCFDALGQAHLQGVNWELQAAFERRAAALLPGLLLARVDGKSPVEYLSDDVHRAPVRRCARALLQAPVATLAEVAAAWQRELGT